MNEKWSLDILDKGYDDPKFKADFAKVDTLIEEAHKLAASLDENNRKETIIKIIKLREEFEILIQELYSPPVFRYRKSSGASRTCVRACSRTSSGPRGGRPPPRFCPFPDRIRTYRSRSG